MMRASKKMTTIASRLCYYVVCLVVCSFSVFPFLFSVNVFKTESIYRYLPSSIQLAASMSTNTGGPIEQAITEALQMKLEPIHLEVVNESYMHNVPKGAETHFKVLVVSEKFESLPLIKVRKTLQTMPLNGGIVNVFVGNNFHFR